jgi:hypothetical protein
VLAQNTKGNGLIPFLAGHLMPVIKAGPGINAVPDFFCAL